MIELYAIRAIKTHLLKIVFLAKKITDIEIAKDVPIRVLMLKTGSASADRCININNGHKIPKMKINTFLINPKILSVVNNLYER